ncbi:MAG: YbjN domain-containing protein [Pseudomonadota bacterium]
MSAIDRPFENTDIHPIDIVETFAEQSAWDFDRMGEDQIAMSVEGAWRHYSLSLAWSERDDLLRLIATFELKPPEGRENDMRRLIGEINDRIWHGGFSLWPDQGLLAFRYGLTLAGGASATPEQIEHMILSALALSEKFYPAFQSCAFTEMEADEALEMVIEDAYGTA